MQRLEVSAAVRPIYGSLGIKRLRNLSAAQTALHLIWISVGKKKTNFKARFDGGSTQAATGRDQDTS